MCAKAFDTFIVSHLKKKNPKQFCIWLCCDVPGFEESNCDIRDNPLSECVCVCVWPCLKDVLPAGRRTKNRITRAALPMQTSRHTIMAASGLFFSEKKNQTKTKAAFSGGVRVKPWGRAEPKLTSKGPKHHSFSGCGCLWQTPIQGCGRQSNPKCLLFLFCPEQKINI